MLKNNSKIIYRAMIKRPIVYCIAIFFAITGSMLILNSSAATGDNNVEPENGTIIAPASIVNDSSASNGKVVKFASASTSNCPNTNDHMPDSSDGMGGCWPGPLTTGVPAGTNLTNYTGPMSINTANTIIDSKNITGCLDINAPGVIIRKSKISCNGFTAIYSGDGAYSGNGLLIEDSEITCDNAGGTGISEANVTARKVNIYGCENGLDINQNITLENSYVHDLYTSTEAHSDGAQFSGHLVNGQIVQGSLNVNIIHNTIYGMSNKGTFETSSIISNRGGDTNILIQNNLFAGGGYTLYCEQNSTGFNYRVLNNRFSTRFSAKIGFYGASTDCSDETQSANKIEETGQAITLD